MHYIDSADNNEGQFQNGNANEGVKGTVVDSSWLNSVQNEISNVVVGAGESLSKDDDDQLKSAILYLPRMMHKRELSSFEKTEEGFTGSKVIYSWPGSKVGAFVDASVNVKITVPTNYSGAKLFASIVVRRKNNRTTNLHDFIVDSNTTKNICCRWCFEIPDDVLEDDDAVKMYVSSRTMSLVDGPVISVYCSGSYSLDPNL